MYIITILTLPHSDDKMQANNCRSFWVYECPRTQPKYESSLQTMICDWNIATVLVGLVKAMHINDLDLADGQRLLEDLQSQVTSGYRDRHGPAVNWFS